jgi:hypothetical protein
MLVTSDFTRRLRNLDGQTTALLVTRDIAALPGASFAQNQNATLFAGARCMTSGSMPTSHRKLQVPRSTSSKQDRL